MSITPKAPGAASDAPSFGFVGLGHIGAPMAYRLVASGHRTVVFDLREDACERLAAAGAQPARSGADLAAQADLIGICVRDDADVRRAVLGPDGLLAGAAPGTLLAVHSTILPRTAVALAATCRKRGVDLIDAAVTGGRGAAEDGRLCCMVGGDAALFERYRPAATCFASLLVHAGPLGTGAAAKLCNNLVLYMGYLAAAEATALADAAGVSREVLFAVTGSRGTFTPPMKEILEARGLALRGEPGIRDLLAPFADLAQKDLAQAIEHARELGVELPGTGRCRELMWDVYGIGRDPARAGHRGRDG
jgi:3-hydroxyisobutyrate dehydrogenase